MIQREQNPTPESSPLPVKQETKKPRLKRFYKAYRRTSKFVNFSAILAALFTLWLNHQAEVRQQISSEDLNHQTILDGHINNIKEIKLSGDYKLEQEGGSTREDEFIRSMTLPILRELSQDEDRKAQLVLFLHQLNLKTVSTLTDSENSEKSFFQTADLKFGNFKGYKLIQINFKGADLRGTNLESADFTEANLQFADLSCASRNVERWWSWIPFVPEATQETCTRLNNITLRNAKLTNAILNNANFDKADLTGADLTEVNLTEANLTGATITDPQLNQAILCGTTLSSGRISNRDCIS